MAGAALGNLHTDSEELSASPGFAAATKEYPCLLSLRCLPGSGAYGAVAVSLCPTNDGPPPGSVVFQNRRPKHLWGHCLINSLDNYLVVEDMRTHTGFKLVDPFSSSWPVLAIFPRRCRHPRLGDSVFKMVAALPFTPGSVAVALTGFLSPHLVCTTQGADRWTARDDLTRCGEFHDLILHKEDGLFYALSREADKVFSLGFSVNPHGRIDDVSIEPFDLHDTNADIVAEASRDRCLFQEARFVDSPSGLFVVRWRMTLTLEREEKKERAVHVYKFSPQEKAWLPVESLDGYTFLVGCRQSIALSAADFPELRSNRIYICSDAGVEMRPRLVNVGRYGDDIEYNLIYDMGSRSWEQWEPLFGPQDTHVAPPMWMMLPSSVIGKDLSPALSNTKSMPVLAQGNPKTSSSQTAVLEADFAFEPGHHVKEEALVKIPQI